MAKSMTSDHQTIKYRSKTYMYYSGGTKMDSTLETQYVLQLMTISHNITLNMELNDLGINICLRKLKEFQCVMSMRN